MKRLIHFFTCYLHRNAYFRDLDNIIATYKTTERQEFVNAIVTELYQIIQTQSYPLAIKIIREHGAREFPSVEEAEKFIKYIYNQFLNCPTKTTLDDFLKNYKCVFCPICGTDKNNVCWDNLINKASVIGKDIEIFICKHCKIMWLTEDIRANNSQDYKKFMKSLGLKGTWKELEDVDFL